MTPAQSLLALPVATRLRVIGALRSRPSPRRVTPGDGKLSPRTRALVKAARARTERIDALPEDSRVRSLARMLKLAGFRGGVDSECIAESRRRTS